MPAIDHLTMVVAGAFLFYIGSDGDPHPLDRVAKGLELACIIVGTFLFTVGAGTATISALGIRW